MATDLKAATPDTTIAAGAFLFGADSQASASPSVYQVDTTLAAYFSSLLNGQATLSGATVTTTAPLLNHAQTWNAGAQTFTGWKLNVTDTASAAGSLLLDLQVGGSSKFNVDKTGIITQAGGSQWTTDANAFVAWASNGRAIAGRTDFSLIPSAAYLGWGDMWSFESDLKLYRDAANTLALQNGTNAQTFNVYNTWSSAGTNFERMGISWSSNVCYLKNAAGGTGAARLLVPVTGSTTVASLPSAATAGAGARSFVTDASATTYLSTVSGGGANKVPVVSDGTNWLIG